MLSRGVHVVSRLILSNKLKCLCVKIYFFDGAQVDEARDSAAPLALSGLLRLPVVHLPLLSCTDVYHGDDTSV